MDDETRRLAVGPGIFAGLMGAGIGMALSKELASVSGATFALGGFILGYLIGAALFASGRRYIPTDADEEPQQHYHLAKEMRAGYHEQVLMKRIMEIYHPEASGSDEDEEENDEAEDEAPKKPVHAGDFSWSWQDNDKKDSDEG